MKIGYATLFFFCCATHVPRAALFASSKTLPSAFCRPPPDAKMNTGCRRKTIATPKNQCEPALPAIQNMSTFFLQHYLSLSLSHCGSLTLPRPPPSLSHEHSLLTHTDYHCPSITYFLSHTDSLALSLSLPHLSNSL